MVVYPKNKNILDVFASSKNAASGVGSNSDFIFNANSRISASAWAGTAAKTINVWLEIQEI